SNRNSLSFNPKPHPPPEPSPSYCRPPLSSPTNRQPHWPSRAPPRPHRQQATIFHSTISHHALSQHGSHTGLAHAKAQPVQLTAINLQIQPAQSQ
ncbi:hypothetical protein M9458_014298, partial [Cirrhinus mrigala]